MHHTQEKGTKVNRKEHSPKTPRSETGIFAALRAFLRHPGSSAPSRRRLSVPAAALAALTAAALLLVSQLAFAENEHHQEPGPPYVNYPPEGSGFSAEGIHATRAVLHATLCANGSKTSWQLETAPAKTGPWDTVGEGTVMPSTLNKVNGTTEACSAQASATHLTPETHYYARLVAQNEYGTLLTSTEFTTAAVSRPEYTRPECNFHWGGEICSHELFAPNSADLATVIQTNGAQTTYHCEYSTFATGPWTAVPGAAGTITVAEDSAVAHIHLEGLTPETLYYVKCVAENAKGATTALTEPVKTHTDHPDANFDADRISHVAATSAHLRGGVHPNGYETHWRFEYATTETGPWLPGPEGTILQAQAAYTEEGQKVEGDLTGLSASAVYYVRLFAENANGSVTSKPPAGFETAGPPRATTFATHTLAAGSETIRALGSVTPRGHDTHVHVQYVSLKAFGASGWAEAQSGPEVDLGEGGTEVEGHLRVFTPKLIGVDFPAGLQPGAIYRYRLLASNEKGSGEGNDQTLTVPATPEPGPATPCPNEAFRTGPSAHLPDCRAYEQLTPVDKGGATEPFKYGIQSGGVLVGEDGDHLLLDKQLTAWGRGPGVGQSPYFFSRTPGGWGMTAAGVQPEAGISPYSPKIFSPDLTRFGFNAEWATSEGVQSPAVEFKAGPPGGPYATVASVPRKQVDGGQRPPSGWVAASADFSKLILQVADRNLMPGHLTGTTQGYDLYEYSEGRLRQANVSTGGATIGACGARIVDGQAEGRGEGSSPRAVSADGSRVFFQAAPGECATQGEEEAGGPRLHLYMRVGGAETVDIGAYRFLAADARGAKLLLEARSGETREYFLYDVASATPRHLFTLHSPPGTHAIFALSEDLSTIYFASTERLTPDAPPLLAETGFDALDVYRYDIPTETLRFLAQGEEPTFTETSPDGRYLYLQLSGGGGIPGGDPTVLQDGEAPHGAFQFYRYDSAEGLLQCVSCASSFDPRPRMEGRPIVTDGTEQTVQGLPVRTASADGSHVFFYTAAALLPTDLNGEIAPEAVQVGGKPTVHPSVGGQVSTSTDVYEWSKPGTGGCVHLQGCLSLISTGAGGYFVLPFGTDASGRDLFFTTTSQLVPPDNDTAGDIYDARIGGGFAYPARPVECEGDACSTPFAPPSDLTPSSSTFHGAGNLLGATLPEVKGKSKAKAKSKCKAKAKKKKKCKAKAKPKRKGTKAKAKRAAHRSHGGAK
jgi:hypothetical protein